MITAVKYTVEEVQFSIAKPKPLLKLLTVLSNMLIAVQHNLNNEFTFKKYKTCTVFLSSYRNTSGSLGEREMLWEHEPQASVSTAFSSSPKISGVCLYLDRNTQYMFSISV